MHAIEGDPEKDFFEQNPELRYIPDIKRQVDRFGEKKAGHFMWAAYMFEDPRSKIYKVPIDERTEIVLKGYLAGKVDDAKIEELRDIREAYPRIILTKNQILYKGYADKIDEANVYIRSLNFDTHGDKILSMLEKVTKMWPTYEKISEKMEEEESANSEVRRGVKESHREKRTT
jgi:IS1 family transposase